MRKQFTSRTDGIASSRLSFSRRQILTAPSIFTVSSFPSSIDRRTLRSPDGLLLAIAREIVAMEIRLNTLIAEQGQAERAMFREPDDPQHRQRLLLIDETLERVHDVIEQLVIKITLTPATTLIGLQIKAGLARRYDFIGESLYGDILCLGSQDANSKT